MFIPEYNVLLQAGRNQSQVTSKELIQDHLWAQRESWTCQFCKDQFRNCSTWEKASDHSRRTQPKSFWHSLRENVQNSHTWLGAVLCFYQISEESCDGIKYLKPWWIMGTKKVKISSSSSLCSGTVCVAHSCLYRHFLDYVLRVC